MVNIDHESNMNFPKRADNVYVIDTYGFGSVHHSSCFIVEGKEIALIDTGVPKQVDKVRAGIKEHGFSISDVSYIFVTHCEHADHSGNVGAFVKENPKIKVYINPIGLELLLDASKDNKKRQEATPPQVAAEHGEQIPVPRSSIELLNDGDVFDIGNGEKLRIMFTSGHQPSGLVIFEEKNNGLFINDIVGDYFADADFLQVLTPPGSDVVKSMEALKKFLDMPISKLYLGHFGIHDKPKELIQRALNGFQQLMDIAAQCMEEGKPEEIESRVFASKLPEMEKVRKTRGEKEYEFTRDIPSTIYSINFAQYYLDLTRKQ